LYVRNPICKTEWAKGVLFNKGKYGTQLYIVGSDLFNIFSRNYKDWICVDGSD